MVNNFILDGMYSFLFSFFTFRRVKQHTCAHLITIFYRRMKVWRYSSKYS